MKENCGGKNKFQPWWLAILEQENTEEGVLKIMICKVSSYIYWLSQKSGHISWSVSVRKICTDFWLVSETFRSDWTHLHLVHLISLIYCRGMVHCKTRTNCPWNSNTRRKDVNGRTERAGKETDSKKKRHL